MTIQNGPEKAGLVWAGGVTILADAANNLTLQAPRVALDPQDVEMFNRIAADFHALSQAVRDAAFRAAS